MDERQETLQSISLKVLNILEMFYSRESFSHSKAIAILHGLIENVLTNDVTIYAGSLAEGTSISGSDSDTMFVTSGICAVKSTESIPDLTGLISYFQTELESTRSGFCMLRLLKFEDLTRLHKIKHVNVKFSDCLVTYGNQKYLSSKQFGNMMVHIHEMNSPGIDRGSDVYRHGPCATTNFKQPIFTDGTRDLAFAIQCHSWPDASMEWLSRPRRHGWPSKELIDSARKLPCYLMCIGDQESPNFNLEWRFAFVCQELELVWSFSNVQILCYILLKALKRAFVCPLFPDEINSYHFKTTMFWLVEQKPSDLWKKENLLQCILICLDKLKEFIRAGNLPHFFLKERNLLYNKLKKQSEKQRLLSVLAHIQDNIVESINEALTSVVDFFLGGRIRLSDFGINIVEVLSHNLIRRMTDGISAEPNLDDLYTKMTGLIAPPKAILDLYKRLETLDLDKRIMRRVKSFLRIRIAMQYHSLLPLQDEYMKRKMLHHADYNLKASCALDGMSGYLYYATFALVHGDLGLAEARVLSLLEKDRQMLHIEHRHHTRYHSIIVQDGKLIQQNRIPTDIDIKHDECIALDFYFALSDLFSLPEALQYECALLGERNRNFPYCTINPVVYAYFLLTTVSIQEKNVIKVNNYLGLLDGAVREVGMGIFRHVALNLLGFSYYKAGKPDEAYNIFCQSLQDHNSCKNAAFYHLCILILDLLSERNGN